MQNNWFKKSRISFLVIWVFIGTRKIERGLPIFQRKSAIQIRQTKIPQSIPFLSEKNTKMSGVEKVKKISAPEKILYAHNLLFVPVLISNSSGKNKLLLCLSKFSLFVSFYQQIFLKSSKFSEKELRDDKLCNRN